MFGISELGVLISRVQSAVISSGSAPERMILERVQKIANLDEFLKLEIMPDRVVIATKRQIKQID